MSYYLEGIQLLDVAWTNIAILYMPQINDASGKNNCVDSHAPQLDISEECYMTAVR
jgi:hypothetical protein